jgi:hypothetical protein
MQSTDPFQRTEDEYFRLKGQLAAGRITPEQFQAALNSLMVQDAHSRWWMIGADTGKWYVSDGRNWIEAQPPTADSDTAPTLWAIPTPARKSSPAALIACGGCVLAILLGVAAIVFALSQGFVRISLTGTAVTG